MDGQVGWRESSSWLSLLAGDVPFAADGSICCLRMVMKDAAVRPALLFDPNRQRRLVEGMVQRVAASREDHLRLKGQHDRAHSSLEHQLAKQLSEVEANCVQTRVDALRQWDEAEEQAIASYEAAMMKTREELRRLAAKGRKLRAQREQLVDGKVERRILAVNNQYNTRKPQPAKQRRREHQQLDQALSTMDQNMEWARALTIRRLDQLLDITYPRDIFEEFQERPPTSVREALDMIPRLNRRLASVVTEMQTGAASKTVDSFYLPAGVAVFIVLWAFGALLLKAEPLLWWMIAGVPIAGVLGFSIYLILLWPLKRMTRQLHPLTERIRHAAEAANRIGKQISTRMAKESEQELVSRRDTHIAEAKRWRVQQMKQFDEELELQQVQQREELGNQLREIDRQFRRGLETLQSTMKTRVEQTASTISQTLSETDREVGTLRQQAEQQHLMTLESLARRLEVGLRRGMNRLWAAHDMVQYRFPAWSEMLSSPPPPQASIDFLPLGNLRLGHRLEHRLHEAIGDVPAKATVSPVQSVASLSTGNDRRPISGGERTRHASEGNGSSAGPEFSNDGQPGGEQNGDAAANFPDARYLLHRVTVPETMPLVLHRRLHSGVLIEAPDQQLDEAVAIAHQLLWRLLTAAPAGRARLTLIDPIGRGQNFASLMALADHDPELIHHRVWTTGDKIAARLAKLAHHVEDVLQASLRDRFERIEDYNAEAGALAEPYHAVAAVGFPDGISREAYSHLMSLIQAGLRCGVFVVLVVRRGQAWPADTPCPDSEKLLKLTYHSADELQSLGGGGTVLEDGVSAGHWRCHTAGLEQFEFRPAPPPPSEVRDPLVRRIGKAAVEAAQVMVPLETLLPKGQLPEAEDTVRTDADISIPIGSQGAGRTLSMTLGHGVRQHVLIAGKTGSGKSTLLHCLITAGAATYRPDQLQFYLLDFKKGVEFKIYADAGLPHARVLGIESEREFGRSVLQRLDSEMSSRGELFRQAGVGELNAFREAKPDVVMPRIMLVIDEFQELFSRDDSLASDCSGLLDRLVRQGRSFGIHVVLSSQSLAGANSLPRATLGQMAVRVAMQCGESDAALILSDDNTAAKLLSRPGEAIYNDAGGLIEGNSPFQVAWMGASEHSRMLGRLVERDHDFQARLGPPIVFEGNRPAVVTTELTQHAVRSADQADALVGLLGESVELGPPTCLHLQATTGRNAMVVAPTAMRTGVLSSLVTTAMMHRPNLELTVLDGARPNESHSFSGWIQAAGIAEQRSVRLVTSRDLDVTLGELVTEIGRRIDVEKSGEATGRSHESPCLLVVDSLDRFRDLRQDDQFRFALDEEAQQVPAAKLQTILKDGPAVGIFTILNLASAETLSRWLPRQSQRDLELRLIGPVNAADSSLLINTPIASDLAAATMVLFDEATGQLSKFRLCDPPTGQQCAEWFDRTLFESESGE